MQPAGRKGPALFLTLSESSSLQTSRCHPPSIPPAASSSLPEPGGDPWRMLGALPHSLQQPNHEGTASLGAGARNCPRLVTFLWAPWEREPRCVVQKRRGKPRLLLLPMATLSCSTAQDFLVGSAAQFYGSASWRDYQLRDEDSVFNLPSSSLAQSKCLHVHAC